MDSSTIRFMNEMNYHLIHSLFDVLVFILIYSSGVASLSKSKGVPWSLTRPNMAEKSHHKAIRVPILMLAYQKPLPSMYKNIQRPFFPPKKNLPKVVELRPRVESNVEETSSHLLSFYTLYLNIYL